MAKFTFIKEENDFVATSTTTVNFSAVSLDEILKEFEYFLRGSGFHFDGTLDIVDDGDGWNEDNDGVEEFETPQNRFDGVVKKMLLQESDPLPTKGDPWTGIVNRHEDELDQKYLNDVFGSSYNICPVCKLSKDVMQSHKCWDVRCPINECGK